MHGIETNPGPTDKKKIRIAHININSITTENKREELEQFIITNNMQIVALTETKLDDTVADSQYMLHDFHPPIVRNRSRHGGGVALYCHKSLPIQRLLNIEIGNEEWVWAKVKIANLTLIINCTYLPPHLSSDRLHTFLDTFTEAICLAQNHSPTAVIALGDFNTGNIYLDHSFSRHSGITSFDHKLKETTDMLNLNQLINEPTRLTNEVANLRDLIFTSNADIIQHSGTLSSFANLDHLPIFVELDAVTVDNAEKPPIVVWEYRKMNIDLLTKILTDTDWGNIMEKDIDTATSQFITTLHDAASATIPKILIRRKCNDKSWITNTLKRNIRKRDRLLRLAKQTQNDFNWARWRHQRNLVTAINRQLKSEHIKRQVEKLTEQRQTPYKYHKTLRAVIGRSSDKDIPPLLTQSEDVVTNDMDKATLFNDYFASQSTLDISDDYALPDTKKTSENIPKLQYFTISEEETLQMLNSLDANKSTGPDGLPTRFLKLTALLIAKPLSQLFNKSLSLGVYPTEFKIAHVKPIFKNKGSPSDISNYRPISILSVVSKIFEKLVYRNIYAHITDHKLLTDKQSGYRVGHSTELQLHYLTQNLYKSLDNGGDFTAIFLDISKYFDKIWHKGLIYKCEKEFGISGTLLNWLKSYLSDRKQVVKIQNSLSAPRKINAGCPQGSVLGPLLALIYLNDLSTRTTNDILFFADDTSLYASHTCKTLTSTQSSLQLDLDEIKKYGQEWAIKFNDSKTVQQTFSHQPHNTPPQLTFGRLPIPATNTHSHLGLTFSKDLRFHEHINVILKKANKSLSPLYPIAHHLPRNTLDAIYKTYVRPYLDYCDTIYDGHITIHDTMRLETFQNRAARLTTGALFRTSSDKLHKELGWDKLKTRRELHRLLLYHKLATSESQNVPNYIISLMPRSRQQDTNRSLRNAGHHSQPHVGTTKHQRTFFTLTGKQWNHLPGSIRTLPYKDFKKKITEHLCIDKPPPYYLHGTKALNTMHTRIRLNMTQLNEDKYKIQKIDNPKCSCGYSQENIKHYLFSCHNYDQQRDLLYNNLQHILNYDLKQRPISFQLEVLLHGRGLGGGGGRQVARHFQNFLQESGRFAGKC